MNSIKILFDTSLLRVVGDMVLFLCFSFAVPSTMVSLLLDYVVRDRENIQSSFVKFLAGFAFNEEVPAGAMDHSLIPIERTMRTLHFWNCFA